MSDEQYELGKFFVKSSLIIAAVLCIVFWAPMLLGVQEFNALGFMIPLAVAVGGTMPGLHAMALNSRTS